MYDITRGRGGGADGDIICNIYDSSVTALWHRIWKENAADPDLPPTLRKAGAYPLLALVVLILGVNWPILSIGLESISPLWMTALRLSGGTLAVFVLTAATGRLRPPPRADLPVVFSVAGLRLALVYLMVFTALQFVPPGRSSVLVWTASLWAVPIAWLVLGERMTRLRWAGLGLGLLGIVSLFEPWSLSWAQPGVATGHLLLLAAAISNAATSVHIRRHSWTTTPLHLVPWQLLIATVPMVTVAVVVEGIPRIPWTAGLGLVVAYQGILATGVALWAQVSVLRSLPAVSTNLSLMLVPVVGLISSVIIVDEIVTPAVVLAVVGIFAGVTLNLLADRRL